MLADVLLWTAIVWLIVLGLFAVWLGHRAHRREAALRDELDRLQSLGTVESHREVR